MSRRLKLYLFGDQTFDVQSHLADLLSQRDNPLLEDFLAKSYKVIRRALYSLPLEVQDGLPRFSSVEDLLLWQQTGKRCIPLDMALACMYQLGLFIVRTSSAFPDPDDVRMLGLCTGALAAAAVSCSRSVSHLVPLAVMAVDVAFRTGLRVADSARRLDPSSDYQPEQSWSMIVTGPGATDAVVAFCKSSGLPATSQPYITAYAPTGITVTGSPRSLAHLRASNELKDCKMRSIPIYGPYHNPYRSSEEDVNQVMAETDTAPDGCSTYFPVLSGTGEVIREGTSPSLIMRSAVEQILISPIHWTKVLGELQQWLPVNTPENAFLVEPFGSTAAQSIYSALKQNDPCRMIPSASKSDGDATEHQGLTGATTSRSKLAIIGSSGRYPGAKDNEALWNVLRQGLDVHKPVPALHWDAKTHVDPSGKAKNTSATSFGCWLDDPASFDARFFNILPQEAAQVDPAQRIALMTAYEALEEAGLVPDATPSTRRDRVGVFYGVTSNDWMETNSAQQIDTYFIPGGNRAFIPGRINYRFKFSGPSFAVDTACSSSLAGIHIACNALWRGDIDTAIAGGTNILTNPDFTAGIDRGHFLSRTGNCKTFDDAADGYCRGEGVGTVIIKRLEDAIAENDPIEAVILGASTNHSAESESITRPHVGAQCEIFSKILNQASVHPYDVSYVEMHGTGTQAGDAGEMSSVLSTFAPPLSKASKSRAREQTLFLGSLKANIGHGEAASGVSALIKVLLMMKHNEIAPNCGIKTKTNHKFPTDLEERHVHIALKPTQWSRSKGMPRRAFVNNFSAAGGNSALLLEDAMRRTFHSTSQNYPDVTSYSDDQGYSME